MVNKDNGLALMGILIMGVIITSIGILYLKYYNFSITKIEPLSITIDDSTSKNKLPVLNKASTDSISLPLISGSCLKYNVPGVSLIKFRINYKYSNPQFDTSFNKVVYSGGCLYLEPSPESETMTIEVTAESEEGRLSDTISFTNQEWWNKVKNSKTGFAMEHTFLIK